MSSSQACNGSKVTWQGTTLGEPLRYALLVAGSLALLSGVFGNVLLLLVAWRRRKQRAQRRCPFVVNLAAADLVVVGFFLPCFLADLVLGHHPVAGQVHCR